MEELRQRHRQELRNLQSRVTQKKRSATKKTRKGVNDECNELERQLQEKHKTELAAFEGEVQPDDGVHEDSILALADDAQANEKPANDLSSSMKSLSVSNGKAVNGGTKKPNRQKARLARRAAEQEAAIEQAAKEAEDLPSLRAQESEAMHQQFGKYGLEQHEIRSDGHCLYAAIADQLTDIGLPLKPNGHIEALNQNVFTSQAPYKCTREVAASFIAANPNDFVPFLEEPLDRYVHTIRETGEWGGHVELLALARAYGRNIYVLHSSGSIDNIDCGSETHDHPLWLAYYRHNYGLGEHYNSLRRVH